jgi:hypothetical protein
MWIRDPGLNKFGFGIREGKSRIRDKHPGSVTLVLERKAFGVKKKLEPESGGKADIWPVPLVGNDISDVGEHGL